MSEFTVPDVLDALGIEYADRGRRPFHILCLFHEEDTPSLAVWDDHAHCYACNWHGGPWALVVALTGCSWAQAAHFLQLESPEQRAARPAREEEPPADLTDVFNSEPAGSWTDEWLHRWLESKWPDGLVNVELLARWGLKVGRYNLLIPHRDVDGVVRGVKTRSLAGQLGKKSSFTNSCFTTRLYRVVERPKAFTAILVEGESDTWTLSAWYDDVAVYGLPSGSQCWKLHFAAELSQHAVVLVALDNDDAGQRAVKLVSSSFPNHLVVPAPFNDVTEAVTGGWTPPPV